MSMFLNSLTIASTTVQTTIPKTTEITSQIPLPVAPVSPEMFAGKVNTGGGMILQVVSGFVVPVVSIGIIISILTYMIGAILHADKVRKAGAAGLGSCILGFLLYTISPSIMGLLYTIGQALK